MENKKEAKEEVKEEDPKKALIREMEEQRAKLALENDRLERNMIKAEEYKNFQTLGGVTDAGQSTPKKPARLTDVEYSQALLRGEVNPLKEDGII